MNIFLLEEIFNRIKTNYMDNKDIVFCILQHLNITEIIKCSTINALIKNICDMQYERLLICDYGKVFTNIFNDKSSKQIYVKCYHLNIDRKLYMPNILLINFVNLTKMDLSGHQIKKIPESIGQLINLQELGLYNNQIEEIPKSIGQLINLQELGLSNNQIEEIPKS